MARAITEVVADGTAYTEPGRGTFVAARGAHHAADYSWQAVPLGRARVDAARASRLGAYGDASDLPLSWGYLAAELQPRQVLQSSASRVVKRAQAWDMAPPTGIPELRRVFAAEAGTDPEDVIVMPGGQLAISFVFRTLGTPGGPLLIESPSYPGAIIAAQAAGLEPVAVPCDGEGIMLDLLEECLIRTGARLLYLQPTYANPTGVTTSPARRAGILALARAHGAFIVEDDWARHLGLEGSTPAPLFSEDPDGHVITITSLSKPAAPSLRVGAILARGPAGARLRAARLADDMCVPRILQETALELVTSPQWRGHLKRLRTALISRRDTLRAEVARHLPGASIAAVPLGGLHLWVRLPGSVDETALTESAGRAGLLVGNGAHFFVDEAPAPFIRLSFGSASEPQIREGLARLGGLLPRQN